MNPVSIHHHTPYVLKSIILLFLIILSPAQIFSVKSTPVELGFCPLFAGECVPFSVTSRITVLSHF